MLVLTRKTQETIRIGDNITITVLQIKGRGAIRIGIEAPKDVRVLRGEVIEAGPDVVEVDGMVAGVQPEIELVPTRAARAAVKLAQEVLSEASTSESHPEPRVIERRVRRPAKEMASDRRMSPMSRTSLRDFLATR